MKRWNHILQLFLAFLLGAAVSLGAVCLRASQLRKDASGTAAQKTAEIENYLQRYFVAQYDETELADAVADAMVKATGDRWSYYISAADFAAYKEQMDNAYVGIGVTVQPREDASGFDVTAITAGGPAEAAGVLAGDILLQVDGNATAGLSSAQLRTLVRGEAGSSVQLTLQRQGQTLELQVERRQMQIQVASWQMLDGAIAYIKIENFDANCAAQTIAAIEEASAAGAKALLFDVRNNPGGYKTELVQVLDYLLPEGPLFRMQSSSGEETVDESDAACVTLPMAVLVNENSYSAAEFFAAALQEYGVGEVTGVQTCGKGYYQNTYPLSDGSAVAISSGTYYTPNGVSLIGTGVTPDQTVSLSEEEAQALASNQLDWRQDPQLQAAMAGLLEQ